MLALAASPAAGVSGCRLGRGICCSLTSRQRGIFAIPQGRRCRIPKQRTNLVIPTSELQRLQAMRDESIAAKAAREAREFSEKVADGRASYASMLSRLWQEAQRTLVMVETSSESQLPLGKRTAALRDIGKLLPQLAKAEDNQVKRLGKKALEDMSERELATLVGRELKRIKRAKVLPAADGRQPSSRQPG